MLLGETSRCTMPEWPAAGARLRVGVLQGLERLVGRVEGRRQRQARPGRLPVAGRHPVQVAAQDVFGRQEVLLADLAEVEHGDDVRVHQAGGHVGLVDELRHHGLLLEQLRTQALDDEAATKALGAEDHRRVDLGHAPLTQPVEQHVAAEGLLLVGLGHGGRRRRQRREPRAEPPLRKSGSSASARPRRASGRGPLRRAAAGRRPAGRPSRVTPRWPTRSRCWGRRRPKNRARSAMSAPAAQMMSCVVRTDAPAARAALAGIERDPEPIGARHRDRGGRPAPVVGDVGGGRRSAPLAGGAGGRLRGSSAPSRGPPRRATRCPRAAGRSRPGPRRRAACPAAALPGAGGSAPRSVPRPPPGGHPRTARKRPRPSRGPPATSSSAPSSVPSVPSTSPRLASSAETP